ncbi:MAG: hypothetical protein ABEJ24_00335 [Candidatus Magasanikbacteria bacterium]
MIRKIAVFIIILALFLPLEAEAVSISPLRQAVSIEKGEKKQVQVSVKNTSDSRKKFVPEVSGFDLNSRGSINYEAESIAEDWLLYDRNPFVLDPGEEKEVSFTINIPNEAKSKSYYLVLFIKRAGIERKMAASPKVGSLLFVHVAGTRVEKMSIDSFVSSRNYYFSTPVNINMNTRNLGSIHVIPQGAVSILDNGEVVAKKEINKSKQMVLPDGTFSRELSFSNLNWTETGKLKAVAYLKYGRTSKTTSASTEFWFIPKKVLIFTGVLIIALLFLLFRLKSKIKKYD